MTTLGTRITEYRKRNRMTQEQLAEYMEVSPQAVSKWENDISCPDITALPRLAELFHITVDELLVGERKQEVAILPPQARKPIENMLLRIRVDSSDGDKIKVNLPLSLIKAAMEIGMEIPQFNGADVLKHVDIEQILNLVDQGVIGKLIEVETSEGDIIEIYVE